MKKAVAYTRVSGPWQSDKDGPERQLEAIKTFAQVHGYQITAIYRETITGKSELDGRPELSALREDLLKNGCRTVIIERLDRLARDLMIQEAIIEDFRKKELEIVSTLEPDLCSTDPTRVLMRQILGAFAQYERAMVMTKLNGAKARLAAQGKLLLGEPSYGYRKVRVDGRLRLEKDPEEQKVIREIIALYARDQNFRNVAGKLNEIGLRTRRDREWSAMQVWRVLKSKAKTCSQVTQ